MSNPWKESFEDLRSSIERVYEEQQSQEANIIKKARQLAYDIRYEVKKRFGKEDNVNAAAIKKEYLKKLSASPAPGPVKLKAKQMLVGVKEDFDFIEEGTKEKKELYKVTDAESKHTYTRKATRSKAEELRRNPKIASVEKSYGSGEPYEGGKPKKWFDDDGDGKGYEKGEVSGKFKRKTRRESFSNWRDEMGENFFFKTLNEKVSPASPYCDVMPDSKTKSGKEGDDEKVRQNKMLTRREDFNPLMEELGGELVDIQESAALLRTGGALKSLRVPIKIKPPHLPRAPKLPSPKTTPGKPTPPPHTEPAPSPVPHRPGKPTKPGTKPEKPVKPGKKPGTPTKPDKKPGTPTKPGTKPGALVVPNQQTGPLSVPSNQSKPDLNPVPQNLPSPTGSKIPGGPPGGGFPIPKLKLPKFKEQDRSVGISYARSLSK